MTATQVDAGDGLCLTIPALLRYHASERGDAILRANENVRPAYSETEETSRRIAKDHYQAAIPIITECLDGGSYEMEVVETV